MCVWRLRLEFIAITEEKLQSVIKSFEEQIYKQKMCFNGFKLQILTFLKTAIFYFYIFKKSLLLTGYNNTKS
ncbi:unnamed protein product [Paramecium sonneborni]|uniref:Uncharacterized protein n=1 Tax=Paramecium sonneborni TaxID=65129 RepID=A0A8S1QJI1_9CILI|nr:unnamed protein product [Paramecium sonneborni]